MDKRTREEAEKMYANGVSRGTEYVPGLTGARNAETAEPARAGSASGVLSDAQELELFRLTIRSELAAIPNHGTVRNVAVDISGAGFRAMQEDPEYREKVTALIARDIGSSYAPRPASVHIRIGADLESYRADSWPAAYDSKYRERTQNSFYERSADRDEKEPLWTPSRRYTLQQQMAAARARQNIAATDQAVPNEDAIAAARAAMAYENVFLAPYAKSAEREGFSDEG